MSILDWALGHEAAQQQRLRRDGAMSRYFELLVAKTREAAGASPELLDRIERVIERVNK